MLTNRVSRIGQTLAWTTGTMKSGSRPCQFRQGVITANFESFEGSVTRAR